MTTASVSQLTSLLQAKAALEREFDTRVDYKLVGFLANIHRIPTTQIGKTKGRWMDSEGMSRLRRAYAEYIGTLQTA